MPETPNHGYNVPNKGETDWHRPLNENFEDYDTDIEIRDVEANLGNYEPKEGAKFLALDTFKTFLGDGSSWSRIPGTGLEASFELLNVAGNRSGAQSSPVLNVVNNGGDGAYVGGSGSNATSLIADGSDAGRALVTLGTLEAGGEASGGTYTSLATVGGDPDAGIARVRAASGADELRLGTEGNGDMINFSSDGDNPHVGIGTVSPDVPLDIVGQNNWNLSNSDGDVRIGNQDYRLAIGVSLGGAGAGTSRLNAKGGVEKLELGASGRDMMVLDGPSGKTIVGNQDPDTGDREPAQAPEETFRVSTDNTSRGGMYVDATGSGDPAYAYSADGTAEALHFFDRSSEEWILQLENGAMWVTSDGDIEASGNKNFVESVDTDDGEKEVVYTATEAGTPRTEASGVAQLEDGRAEVELPDHFGWVTDDEEPLAVQTTPYTTETGGLGIVERSTERFVVEDLDGGGDYEFAYTVKGTREGQADKQVVREPRGDEGIGAGPGESGPAPADD